MSLFGAEPRDLVDLIAAYPLGWVVSGGPAASPRFPNLFYDRASLCERARGEIGIASGARDDRRHEPGDVGVDRLDLIAAPTGIHDRLSPPWAGRTAGCSAA